VTAFFRVLLGPTVSKQYPHENGVPQGSVISTTLFAIAMNSIETNVRPPVQASLFVDDFANYCASANINVIERQLQLVLNRLYKWSCRNGFTFSPSKTCCIHFCRKHQLHADPVLYLGNIPISFVESNKFLGLHFDGSLTWKNMSPNYVLKVQRHWIFSVS
jgi:hypothetical protein